MSRQLRRINSPFKRRAALVFAFASVIVMTAVSQAQTYQVLYTFTSGTGYFPAGGLSIDKAGNLYGVTAAGGAAGVGVVFKLAPKGPGWVLTPLYDFLGGDDGRVPDARVVLGPDGTLYGTTTGGGGTGCGFGLGCGTVFNLKPPPSRCASVLCPWTETVLYRFNGPPDSGGPTSTVTLDAAGNLYGTAGYGAAGAGVVYELTPSADGAWTETILYSFLGDNDGSGPQGGVVFDQEGNLYGTTRYGGSHNGGTIFQLTPSGGGWSKNLLWSFADGLGGYAPRAGLVLDISGNVYGATTQGGEKGLSGAAFEFVSSSGSLIELYSFQGSDDCYQYHQWNCFGPYDGLVMDPAGNLYGATWSAGPYAWGSVFKLTPTNGGWVYTDLHDFTGGSDGALANGNLVLDASGNLYGTTAHGGSAPGTNGEGVIFQITP